MKRFFTLASATLFMAVSCLQKNYAESSPILAADTGSVTVEAIAESGQEIISSVNIKANQSWGAVLLSESGESISWARLLKEEHLNLSGVSELTQVNVVFEANLGTVGRKAVLKVSSSDCGPVEVVFTQSGCEPVIRIDTENMETSVRADQTESEILFTTNTDWTARIKENGTFNNPVLSLESGDHNVSCITLSYGQSMTSAPKEVTVVFESEGLDPVEVTFRQTGVILTVDFTEQPFTVDLPTTTGTAVSEATGYVLRQEDEEATFVITPAGTDGFYWRQTDGVLAFNKVQGTVTFPKFESLRLSSVCVTIFNSNAKNIGITDEDGQTVEGGETVKLKAETHTFRLPSTSANTHYSLKMASSTTYISKIVLVYE